MLSHVQKFSSYASGIVLLLMLLLVISPIQAQDECSPTLPEGWSYYTVHEGDTLSEIARRSGATIEELVRANCLENPRVIRVGARLAVPLAPDSVDNIVERCRLAGLTIEECRELFDDGHSIVERCRLAGLTIEECREIVGGGDDVPGIIQRCRNAGLTIEECREIVSGGDSNNLAERCRNAGFTIQECRRIINANNDGGDDGNTIPEECREAGYTTPEECRRYLNSLDDGNSDDGIVANPVEVNARPANPTAVPTRENNDDNSRDERNNNGR